MTKLHPALALLVIASGLASCGSAEISVRVAVASSLAAPVEELAAAFENDNPGVVVRLNVAGSSTLVRQLNDGASVDVFLPADASVLQDLTVPISAPVPLVDNTLTLVVPPDSAVRTPAEVTDRDVVIARCSTGVPCGDATDLYLTTNGFALAKASEHLAVSGVVQQVVTGETDAGFVYVTDAKRHASLVTELPLADPPTVNAAAVTVEPADDASSAFMKYLQTSTASQVFESAGFDLPSS